MLLAAVSIISAGILAYEILLTRLLSIVHWHHFAYMVISIALLGFGASGSFLALTRTFWRTRVAIAFAGFAVLFAVTSMACFGLAQLLPFNALELVWDPKQLLYLLALYVLLTVPFFCGATCIGLVFACSELPAGKVYFRDLVGAGIGAFLIVLLLYILWPQDVLRVITVLGLIACALALLENRRWIEETIAASLIGLAIAVWVVLPAAWIELSPTPYKPLSQTMTIPGTRIEVERSSPLGLASAIRSDVIPFRHAPGLSLGNTQPPADQIGIFVDGDGPTPITLVPDDPKGTDYLDDTISALPFHLFDQPHVLILGAGGGTDVLLALQQGAGQIDAVELDPNVVDLVLTDFGDEAGHIYARPNLHVHIAEARGFVARSLDRYDLIMLPLLDSFSAASAGTLSLSEGFVYTREAFELYLDHLQPDGVLAITRWLKLPPRDSLKLMATALSALERNGHPHPETQLALVRSWDTALLLVKNSPLTAAEIKAIREFAAGRSFDLAYLPDLEIGEANRTNVLPEPYFFGGAQALAGPARESFIRDYKFDLTPATDDRPYFFDFFKWRSLPELLKLRAVTSGALLDWGYLILVVTLVQAIALSLVLILLPLRFAMKRGKTMPERRQVAAYFAMIGLAFLFVEIACIQRFMLFLNHPTYAIAVVLSAFLLFAGIGSAASSGIDQWIRNRSDQRFGGLHVVVVAIMALAVGYVFGLPAIIPTLVLLSGPLKIAATLLLIAPLAFFMGMPFPLALANLKANAPALVPWAWGINGCASVISAVLATLLAMSFGFSTIVLLATALYAIAAVVFVRSSAIGKPA
ncbi:MAG: SAM-dependent methyltransferase [Geminicoccaceae bacterium]